MQGASEEQKLAVIELAKDPAVRRQLHRTGREVEMVIESV
jgi:hypothetical protein